MPVKCALDIQTGWRASQEVEGPLLGQQAPGQALAPSPRTPGLPAMSGPECRPDEIRSNPDIAARGSEVEGKADMRQAWLGR